VAEGLPVIVVLGRIVPLVVNVPLGLGLGFGRTDCVVDAVLVRLTGADLLGLRAAELLFVGLVVTVPDLVNSHERLWVLVEEEERVRA